MDQWEDSQLIGENEFCSGNKHFSPNKHSKDHSEILVNTQFLMYQFCYIQIH